MVRRNGAIISQLVDVDQDLLVIPSVAIHMDREVNKGTVLKPHTDLLPLLGLGREPGAFRRLIAETAGVGEKDLLSTDLYLYPRAEAVLSGIHKEFVAGPDWMTFSVSSPASRAF